jgi:hypothetical protein
MMIQIPTPDCAHLAQHRDVGAIEVEYKVPSSMLTEAVEAARHAGWEFVKARQLLDRAIYTGFAAITIRRVTPWPE